MPIDLNTLGALALLVVIIGALIYAVSKWPGWKPAPPPAEPYVDSIMEQGYEAVRRAKERMQRERQDAS